MYYDPGALGSLIRIIPKERTHNIPVKEIYSLLRIEKKKKKAEKNSLIQNMKIKPLETLVVLDAWTRIFSTSFNMMTIFDLPLRIENVSLQALESIRI